MVGILFSDWHLGNICDFLITANNSVVGVGSGTDIIPARQLEVMILLLTAYSFIVKKISDSDEEIKHLKETTAYGFVLLGTSAVFVVVKALSQLSETPEIGSPLWYSVGIIIAGIIITIISVLVVAIGVVIAGIALRGLDKEWIEKASKRYIFSILVVNSVFFLLVLISNLFTEQRLEFVILTSTVVGIIALIYSLYLIAFGERVDTRVSPDEFDIL